MESKATAPIALGVTGASGAPYWARLVEVLALAGRTVHVAASGNADTVARAELGRSFADVLESARARGGGGEVRLFERGDFYSPMASGSARYAGMAVVPCSMGTLGRIAQGTSDDLITRAADVMLKERRRLVLVPRETPFNLVHLENMTRATLAGAVVLPAAPGFYHRPQGIGGLVDFVVQRICDQLDVEVKLVGRWGGSGEDEDAAPPESV